MSHKRAVGVEVHRLGRSKLSAMNANGAQARRDLSGISRALQMKFTGQIAAPAGIGA